MIPELVITISGIRKRSLDRRFGQLVLPGSGR